VNKLRWFIVGVLVVAVVLGTVVYVGVGNRRAAIANRAPLSMEELDRLAERTGVQVAEEASQAEGVAPNETQEEAASAPEIPIALAGVPSHEVLFEKFARSSPEARSKVGQDAELLKVFEGALRTLGPKRWSSNFTPQVGEILMYAGEWEDARGYLNQALEESTSRFTFRRVCAKLAWLEEDPEKAAYLLELSIDEEYLSDCIREWTSRGEQQSADVFAGILQERLSNAVELCRATGSDALAEHYLGRLRHHDPEAAQTLDLQHEKART